MPKKHTPAYTKTKPSSIHPSLQSSRPNGSATASEPQTVNQRIAQLRREQAPRPTPEQRDELTSVVSSRTVPPELRRILHIPEVNAPTPKTGARSRRTADGRRLPPGPAAPLSWLHRSRHAPAHTHTLRASSDFHVRFCLLARVTGAELKRFPPLPSLQHQCLKTFALHFEELIEFEQYNILSLPTSLKERLLSYLALYGEHRCLDFRSFKLLYQDDADGLGCENEVQFLDLTGLLSDGLTVGNLGRCIKRPDSKLSESRVGMDLNDEQQRRVESKVGTPAEVVDSWEEEADEAEFVQTIPSAQLKIPYFRTLTRLSLGHPNASASWPDLLKISSSLNKLTHLSLAYWPRPTHTPNAVITSMVSPQGKMINLSGTPFYADLDNDWHEATSILRRFSANTYSLEWLDLEGCSWLKALTFGNTAPASTRDWESSTNQHSRGHAFSGGLDWNDSWRRIQYVNVFQGWIPADNKSLVSMPAGIMVVQLLRWLKEHQEVEEDQWKLNYQESGHAVQQWVERQKTIREIGADIRLARKQRMGLYIKFDHGWD